MPGHSKTQMIYRCPVCFYTTVDIPLIKDGNNFRCLKCSFTGTKNNILAMYNDFKKKISRNGWTHNFSGSEKNVGYNLVIQLAERK